MSKEENLECSFCGRKKVETDLLIAGMGAHICDKCIEQAHGIVLEEILDVEEATSIPDLKLRSQLRSKVFWNNTLLDKSRLKRQWRLRYTIITND